MSDLPRPSIFFMDAIGPFFRASSREKVNWSKIPFADLPEDESFWQRLREEFVVILDKARELGFGAVTLDDMAHLVPDALYEQEVNERIEFFLRQFRLLVSLIEERGLGLWMTTDVMCLSPRAERELGDDHDKRSEFYRSQVRRFFELFPRVEGLILRIGEEDGLDVRDPLRSQLHLKTPKQVNKFLRDLLPITDELGKKVVLRTWTVGTHHVGDLIWHRGRLSDTTKGIESENFILSMKPGESDFFRHLPLNRSFFTYEGPKILELQARREYEGGGEIPSYVGLMNQRIREEMAGVKNLVGVSVWAQTGGWHRFKRLTFLDDNAFWAELNVRACMDVFAGGMTPEQSLRAMVGEELAADALEFVTHADYVMRNLFYIKGFAQEKLFFRRIRIPPMLHVYWDSIFFNAHLRKVLRHWVRDHEEVLREGEAALLRFERMIELAKCLDWPVEDVEFMRDTCEMIALAREYYFTPDGQEQELRAKVKAAKARYKKNWPKSARARYRIKTDMKPSGLTPRTLSWSTKLLLRRKRGYRPILDHIFTLRLLGSVYRLMHHRTQRFLPKFLQDSAMGVDALFR